MRSIRRFMIHYLMLYAVAISLVFVAYRLWVEYPRELETVVAHQARELDSLLEGLYQHQRNLEVLVRDWAHWDDSVAFVSNPADNANYYSTNVLSNTAQLYDLVAMVYLDRDFNLVAGQGFDLVDDTLQDLSEVLPSALTLLMSAPAEAGARLQYGGWVSTSQGLGRFALDYITDSQDISDPAGYLFFVRLLTEAHIRDFERITRLGLNVTPVSAFSSGIANDHGLIIDAELREGFMSTRNRLVLDFWGEPLAVVTITHDPIATPMLFGRGELLMLLGLISIPILISVITDRTITRAVVRNAALMEEMVDSGHLHELPDRFPVRELEQIRGTFNRAVKLVNQQQQHLTELSRTDSLTGIANRRAFDEYADNVWRQAQRLNEPLLLAVLDIDYFKNFNDRLGHQAGDDALQQLGHTLRTFCRRANEYSARLGGEEFAFVCFGATELEATERLEMLRQAVEALAIVHPESKCAAVMTISVGAVYVGAPVSVQPEVTVKHLMQQADVALYRAKEQGRNRVIMDAC
ncbi:diguanylate cyclase [Salinispirillum sp. LH 10-3-1]|uniref:diguanylate cyclase n=1 Tax=Salinispirillum sp. LH 10-3-1 TaxID=2952525 RepID=A0AB38YH97_9GAMM